MSNIEKLQKVQLNILKELIQLCNEHKLKYYAIAGTVLGAVRHKGFIPWDDDIDLSMPREDYEKFTRIVSRMGETTEPSPCFPDETIKPSPYPAHLYLETIYTHDDHESPIMKLTDKRVKMIAERKTIKQKVWSAYIDISPMDGLPDNKISRYFHVRFFLILRKLLYVATFDTTADIYNKTMPLIKRLLMWIIKTFKLHKLFNKKRIAILGDKMLKKHSFYTAKYCSPQLWGRYKTKAVFPTECIGEGTLLQFEDIKICVPADYNRYLSQIYGEDYMELPPVEKRSSHSSDIIFQDEVQTEHEIL